MIYWWIDKQHGIYLVINAGINNIVQLKSYWFVVLAYVIGDFSQSFFWTKKKLLGTWNSGEMVVVCSGFIRQWRNAFVWPKDIESTMKASTIILMMIVLLVLFIKNNIYHWKIMSKYMQIPESTVSSLKQNAEILWDYHIYNLG